MRTWLPDDPWDPGNPENRERTRKLKSELRGLLMAWDPIGVADAPEAQDEYDGYLSPLLHLLHRGASPSEIEPYLSEILAHMGMDATSDRELELARSLVSWWATSTGNTR